MNKNTTRAIAGGVAGFTVLTLAGVTILGLSPAGPKAAPQAEAVVPPVTSAYVSPTEIDIPVMHLKKKLSTLGNAAGGVMQLPPNDGAGWWTGSAVPGRPGGAVVTGFIRTERNTPGVFVHLDALRTHDNIMIALSDGTTSTFRVTSIKAYPAGTLPSTQIFAHSSHPVLKLVTTGGGLKPSDPSENVVVTGDKVS